jgi:uncharacterized OB-fold protein
VALRGERVARAAVERIERDERLERVAQGVRSGRSVSVSSRRIRSHSAISSASSSRMRFPASTAAGGSTKSVCPECELSCTIPPRDAAPLAPHRDHVAPVAQRDRRIVHAMVVLEPGHEPLEQAHQLALGAAHLAADAAQRRRGVVLELTVLGEHAAPGAARSPDGRNERRGVGRERRARRRDAAPRRCSAACVRRDDCRSVIALRSSRPFHDRARALADARGPR